MHYTVDFSLECPFALQYRSSWSTYFKSPLKVHIFGLDDDAVTWQVNYLLPEGKTIGVDDSLSRGPNVIVSMLDHFFLNHAHGEEEIHLHADNCFGQNKTNLQWHT